MHTNFSPSAWLLNPHIQSVLPSLPGRRFFVERHAAPMLSTSCELIIECGNDVRLQGFYSSPPLDKELEKIGAKRILVVLLHGWEGSAQSLYIISLAQALHAQGFAVLRLNLRDHGDTQHWNRELFHSCLLDEVIGAVRGLRILFPERRAVLVGFSLGGNFIVRVACEAPNAQLDVVRAIGISSVLDPSTCLVALEDGPSFYRNYFIHKWIRSLRLKQKAWPLQYDLTELLRCGDLRLMTEKLVLAHSTYSSMADYFQGYALTEDRLANLQVPTTLLTALDDPIIPAVDLGRLARPATLSILTLPYGGHCGFFENLQSPSWIDRFVLTELDAVCADV